jgi:hypothetical protein
LINNKQIRNHYITTHSFEELKLWGINLELLKQELGLPNRYQEDYVKKYDVNDTFRGIETNEKEYFGRVLYEEVNPPEIDQLISAANGVKSNIMYTGHSQGE